MCGILLRNSRNLPSGYRTSRPPPKWRGPVRRILASAVGPVSSRASERRRMRWRWRRGLRRRGAWARHLRAALRRVAGAWRRWGWLGFGVAVAAVAGGAGHLWLALVAL